MNAIFSSEVRGTGLLGGALAGFVYEGGRGLEAGEAESKARCCAWVAVWAVTGGICDLPQEANSRRRWCCQSRCAAVAFSNNAASALAAVAETPEELSASSGCRSIFFPPNAQTEQ